MICGPARADKRVALIVGNSDYLNVPRLANPSNDARLVADTLRALGFALVGGGAQLNLNESIFKQVVQDFGAQLQGADVGLFYYAGHGVQVRGANYLVPIGANPTKEADVDFQMLDTNLVLRQMESAGTKLNIVILDACRNNPFGARGLRATDPGLAQMRAPEGTLISFATQPGNVAADGTDGHSPYTKALTQMMRKPGLDIFRTFNEVGLSVSRATGGAQQPWVSLSPITGDFFFVAAPASVAPAAEIGRSEAERAWTNIKDSRSPTVFEAFIRRYGDSFYSDLARARFDELKAETLALPESHADAAPIDAKPSARLTATGRPILEFGRDQPALESAPQSQGDEFTAMGRRKLRFDQ
jgi:Caspase domain